MDSFVKDLLEYATNCKNTKYITVKMYYNFIINFKTSAESIPTCFIDLNNLISKQFLS